MTSLNPCRRCHRSADCEIKRNTLALLRGSGITKANLRCDLPKKDFPIGSRVTVKAFEMLGDGYEDSELERVATVRQGLVIRWKGAKATVALDKDQEIAQPYKSPIGHLHAEPDRLTRIEAPLAEMCKCGGISKERCEAKDYPALQNGSDWFCAVEGDLRDAAFAAAEKRTGG